VSILAVPGAVGSVVAAGGPAISIAAAGLEVALRNLVIVPFPGGGGTHGVSMTGASHVTIEHSLIAHLPDNAVLVEGSGMVKIVDASSGTMAVTAFRSAMAPGARFRGPSCWRMHPEMSLPSPTFRPRRPGA
jgi:hypothetical protein